MIHIKSVLGRVTPFGAAVALLLASTIPTLMLVNEASAAALSQRSLMVSSTVASNDLTAPDGTTYTGLAAGDPRNGQKVTHTYTITPGTTGTVEGLTIEYCETAFGFMGAGACTATNLLAGGAGTSFSASNWDTKTVTIGGKAFTIDANTANYLTLTENTGGVTFTQGVPVTITFTATANDYFVNPNTSYKSTSNGTYFAHIKTFATQANATGAFAAATPTSVDEGTVTNNITEAIGIYTRVQETLNFSVEGEGGELDVTPGPTPITTGCTPLVETGQLKMGDPNDALDTEQAYKATSYFRLSTNSAYGTNVYYSGDTLKSSNHTMTAIGDTAVASTPGTEQFGLGINTDGVGTETSFTTLAAMAEYDDAGTNDSFAFDTDSIATPRAIAQSQAPNGGVSCDTGQVDYVANISPDTPAGIYQTKISYIASPSY